MKLRENQGKEYHFVANLKMKMDATRTFDFEITCMVLDQIVLHSVQLPLLKIMIVNTLNQ